MYATRFVRHRFSWIGLLAGALVLFLVLLAPAPRAWAHHSLESSSPASGEHLETMPKEVVLNYAAPLLEEGLTVTIVDEAGGEWSLKPTLLGHDTVSAAMPVGLADGRYELRWLVVSFDGAPLSGVVMFSVGELTGDENPWHTVISAQGAAWIAGILFAVFGSLFAYIAYGLVTVYGRGSAPSPRSR